MLLNARECGGAHPQETVYDVCIIGSGPAGMTVCAELVDSGLSVCVLESGLEERSVFASSLKEVRTEGLSIKTYSRERLLGGTSETWGGLSSLFDIVDFSVRPYGSATGWPISLEDLNPYLERVADRYGFPHPRLFGPDGFAALKKSDAFHPEWEVLEEKTFLAPQTRFRFGKALKHIFERPEIDLIVDATAVSLERPHEDGRSTISGVVCKDSAGRELIVHARIFVLAAGTIESVRILLNSPGPNGITLGNEHDQVGRYFMNHPKGYTGKVRFHVPVPRPSVYFWRKHDTWIGYLGLRMKSETQYDERIFNPYLRLEPYFPWTGKAVSAMMRKLGTFPEFIALLCLRVAYGFNPPVRTARIRAFMDMEPNPENRITLDHSLDPLGIRIPKVCYTLSDRDRRSLTVLHDVLARELERLRIGSVETDIDRLFNPEHEDASHHLGGLRMGDDVSTSVVTRDLRMHTIENLYVVGGAVFPTGGCANPTMTIAALSARLAEHLRQRLTA